MNLRERLATAAGRLAAVSDSPRLDAELLLAHVLGVSRAQLLARDDEAVAPRDAAAFERALRRRAAGEPLAYLTGRRGFWTLELEVTPEVLVPRPETELLVEWALERLQGTAAPAVVDLGTGSGAIALALAGERPDAGVLATDASESALAVARRNAERLDLSLHFVRGDWYAACGEARYDLIVSNPPYVDAMDPHLEHLRAEPRAALTPGGDGLSALRRIIGGAPRHLKPRAGLLVEHGKDQGATVRQLFEQSGFECIETRRDLAGHERATGGIWR